MTEILWNWTSGDRRGCAVAPTEEQARLALRGFDLRGPVNLTPTGTVKEAIQ